MLACHFLELGEACHGAVFVEYLDEGGGGLQAAEACEVDGGFGVACSFQGAAVLGVEGVDVAWTSEV